MKKKSFLAIICITATQFLATGCFDRDIYIKVPADTFFDFNLNQDVNLSIDYGFDDKGYPISFEIYDQDPTEVNDNMEVVKKDIEPIYRAVTNGEGKFNGEIRILSEYSEVWLYSSYAGTVSPIKLTINEKSISFNQKEYIQKTTAERGTKTRAVTPNNFKYPDEWKILGDWNIYGTPNYLENERTLPNARTLYNLTKIFIDYDGTAMQNRNPQTIKNPKDPVEKQVYYDYDATAFFGENYSAELKIKKPTKVYLCFINSTAGFNSSVGYFHYPTGQEPTKATDVKKIMAFPCATIASKDNNTGALMSGDKVLLKYWDGEKYQDEFPAGVTIGWWLQAMAFRKEVKKENNVITSIELIGNIESTGSSNERFSLPHLNGDKVQRCVALKEPGSNKLVAIGFEDNIDKRYNDATFYIEIEEDNAIEDNIPSIPDVGTPPTNTENFVPYYGTLAFEDLWPSMGDYDLNDLVIDYSCKVYKNTMTNSVYKIENIFTPRHNGGLLQSGFGFQLDGITPSQIHKINITGAGSTKYVASNSTESGQTYANFLLFDDIKEVLGKPITVTLEVNDLLESAVKPPYNPFIYIESDKSRGKELHLPKYYPTDKVDETFLGTIHDASRIEEKLFYVFSRWNNQFPFAINLPSIKDFPIPEEGVRVDEAYPKYRSWVESKGTKDKDWYKRK